MMKRQILSISLVLTLVLGLAGCSCKHQWKDATCTTPATCAKCGETAGSPLGHNWKDATCTQPETCSVCGATNGEPLGHQWLPATCTEPETCSVCGETQGEAPAGHVLDRNGVCTVCGEAVGTLLTMGNYTQYLNIFIDHSGTPISEFAVYQQSPISTNYYNFFYYYRNVTLSVTPNTFYTYHDVEVTYKLTSNFSEWSQPGNQTLKLDELGCIVDGSIMKAYRLGSNGTPKLYQEGLKPEDANKIIDFNLDVLDITGYVLPVEAGEWEPVDGGEG